MAVGGDGEGGVAVGGDGEGGVAVGGDGEDGLIEEEADEGRPLTPDSFLLVSVVSDC